MKSEQRARLLHMTGIANCQYLEVDLSLTKSSALNLKNLQPLPRAFYNGAPDQVARKLLGKILVRESGNEVLAGRIVETEAYFGIDDPAAHSAAGKTARNAVLFGAPGHAYVYFIYGVHYCLNVSCEPAGHAGCVLIRALEPLAGTETMIRLRELTSSAAGHALTGGPGKLCGALEITRAENGRDMTRQGSPLRIVDDGSSRHADIETSRRVGIRKAADRPLRFFLRGNACISR